MPGFVLGMKINDKSHLRGLGRYMAGIRKQVMLDAANFWHRSIFPRHFNSQARSAYGYKPRQEKYQKFKLRKGVGQGKFVDLLFTGQSRRWMQEGVKVTGTQGRVSITMRVPWYFKNPRGKILNLRQLSKGLPAPKYSSREQPDKPDEVTRFNAKDRGDIRKYAAGRMQELMDKRRAIPTTTTVNP
jgi:hypothetical protein